MLFFSNFFLLFLISLVTVLFCWNLQNGGFLCSYARRVAHRSELYYIKQKAYTVRIRFLFDRVRSVRYSRGLRSKLNLDNTFSDYRSDCLVSAGLVIPFGVIFFLAAASPAIVDINSHYNYSRYIASIKYMNKCTEFIIYVWHCECICCVSAVDAWFPARRIQTISNWSSPNANRIRYGALFRSALQRIAREDKLLLFGQLVIGRCLIGSLVSHALFVH